MGWPRSYGCFSRNRFNLFSFFDRDHGNGVRSRSALRSSISSRRRGSSRTAADPAADDAPRARLRLQPTRAYFCYRRTGALAAIVYEVSNTFGERHNYLIPVSGDGTGTVYQECAKQLFVSPFIGMDINYSFRVIPPDSRVGIAISGRDAQGTVIVASLFARRATLQRHWVGHGLCHLSVADPEGHRRHPHQEALRIWLKGVRPHDHKPAPDHSFTLGRPVDAKEPSRHVA